MTTSAATPAQRLLAPAAVLADVAENPAPTAMPCSRAAPTLHAPSTISSRLASSVSPCASAMVRMLPQDSANTSTTRPKATSPTRSHSARGRSGKPGLNAGRSNAPTSSTPSDFRSNQCAAMIASTITSIDAGNWGQRFRPAIRLAAASATAILAPCHACTCPAANISTCSGPEPASCGRAKPRASGSCRMTMVMASANANPRNTGRDTNADNCPCRAHASSISTMPDSSTRASRACVYASGFAAPAAAGNETTAAAEKVAVDEVGATMAKRLPPNSA